MTNSRVQPLARGARATRNAPLTPGKGVPPSAVSRLPSTALQRETFKLAAAWLAARVQSRKLKVESKRREDAG